MAGQVFKCRGGQAAVHLHSINAAAPILFPLQQEMFLEHRTPNGRASRKSTAGRDARMATALIEDER